MTEPSTTQRDDLADLTARTEGHTRGPWEIRADHGEPPAVWHDSETAFSIGRCADCGVEAVYAPADAELIAAAPKLIAALEAISEQMDSRIAALRHHIDLLNPRSPIAERYEAYADEAARAAAVTRNLVIEATR